MQPIGGVRAVESCEGNVQPSYIDHAGRIRLTCYDAVADSRNTTFEQWLPDDARPCVDVRDGGDEITLAPPVTLPTTGATCEGLVPLAPVTQANGLASRRERGPERGDRRGRAALDPRREPPRPLRVDGWFFDAGIDLARVAAAGWHHFAASTRGTETGFFIDGMKVASRQTQRPVLRFDGAESYPRGAGARLAHRGRDRLGVGPRQRARPGTRPAAS